MTITRELLVMYRESIVLASAAYQKQDWELVDRLFTVIQKQEEMLLARSSLLERFYDWYKNQFHAEAG